MTLNEYLAGQRAGDEGIADMLQAMQGLQQRLSTRIAAVLGDLEISGGALVASEANLARLAEVMQAIEGGFIDPQWEDDVARYLRTFDRLGANTLGWAQELGTVSPGLLRVLQRQYKTIAAEYLLNAQSFSLTLLNPIAQEVGAYIATGSSYRQLVQSVSDIVTGGGEADGALLGNARTAVNDLVSVYERTATAVASEAVGAEFFLYQGRPIDTTRPFCRSRAGRYWHRGEIASWADEEWSGKMKGTTSTTIFNYLGGYNCRHVLVPVSRAMVPEADLERMRRAGYI
jgi:hypothetical protein